MKKNEYLAMKLREYADKVENGAVRDFRVEEAERATPIGVSIPYVKEVLISFEFVEEGKK